MISPLSRGKKGKSEFHFQKNNQFIGGSFFFSFFEAMEIEKLNAYKMYFQYL